MAQSEIIYLIYIVATFLFKLGLGVEKQKLELIF